MTWNFKPEDYEKEDNFDRLIILFDELRKEVKRLERYEKLIHFINNEPLELSHHKMEYQNLYWKTLCSKLIDEDKPDVKEEQRLKDDF